MSKVLKLVSGLPRMVDKCDDVILSAPNSTKYLVGVNNDGKLTTDSTLSDAYDETLVVGPSGVSTGTPVTLPSGGQYLDENDLEVRLNAGLLTFGTDWQFVGDCIRTQIQFTFDLVEDDSVNFKRV